MFCSFRSSSSSKEEKSNKANKKYSRKNNNNMGNYHHSSAMDLIFSEDTDNTKPLNQNGHHKGIHSWKQKKSRKNELNYKNIYLFFHPYFLEYKKKASSSSLPSFSRKSSNESMKKSSYISSSSNSNTSDKSQNSDQQPIKSDTKPPKLLTTKRDRRRPHPPQNPQFEVRVYQPSPSNPTHTSSSENISLDDLNAPLTQAFFAMNTRTQSDEMLAIAGRLWWIIIFHLRGAAGYYAGAGPQTICGRMPCIVLKHLIIPIFLEIKKCDFEYKYFKFQHYGKK